MDFHNEYPLFFKLKMEIVSTSPTRHFYQNNDDVWIMNVIAMSHPLKNTFYLSIHMTKSHAISYNSLEARDIYRSLDLYRTLLYANSLLRKSCISKYFPCYPKWHKTKKQLPLIYIGIFLECSQAGKIIFCVRLLRVSPSAMAEVKSFKI